MATYLRNMKLIWLTFPLFLLTGCNLATPPSPDVEYERLEYRATGDTVEYERLEYRATGDTAWLDGTPTGVGEYEIGLELMITETVDSLQPYALLVSQLASSEAYFDGRYLGSNGVVGTSAAEEVPGPRCHPPGSNRVSTGWY